VLNCELVPLFIAVCPKRLIHDPRIRYPEWARKEKLKSYAGYPLVYKGEAIAVLGMFSEKKLTPFDFEIVGVFCDQLAKELSSLFGAAEFLSVK
jgi:hypothetical protein